MARFFLSQFVAPLFSKDEIGKKPLPATKTGNWGMGDELRRDPLLAFLLHFLGRRTKEEEDEKRIGIGVTKKKKKKKGHSHIHTQHHSQSQSQCNAMPWYGMIYLI